MGKANVSEFIRAAVLEKAERDLARLDQKLAALEAIHSARVSLEGLLEGLSRGTAPVVAIAQDTASITRFKKLRRAVEEASTLAGELSTQLDVEDERTRVIDARAKIVAELASVGVSPSPVVAEPEEAAAQ